MVYLIGLLKYLEKIVKMNRIARFYLDGFRSMTVGKTLWLVIFIKVFIMFAILKIFFFPNFLKTNFTNSEQRGNYVMEQLLK